MSNEHVDQTMIVATLWDLVTDDLAIDEDKWTPEMDRWLDTECREAAVAIYGSIVNMTVDNLLERFKEEFPE